MITLQQQGFDENSLRLENDGPVVMPDCMGSKSRVLQKEFTVNSCKWAIRVIAEINFFCITCVSGKKVLGRLTALLVCRYKEKPIIDMSDLSSLRIPVQWG